MFNILIHKKVLKEIERLPNQDRQRILGVIREMAIEPFSGDVKPIKGIKGLLRRRVGNYRVAFTVNFEKSEVVILKVAGREDFYNSS